MLTWSCRILKCTGWYQKMHVVLFRGFVIARCLLYSGQFKISRNV